MANRILQHLYYITHIDNVPSILQRGILSHKIVTEENVPFTAIYDKSIISRRKNKTTPDGRSLWGFANLFFQPRNAMMYRVICESKPHDFAVIALNREEILKREDVWITTGNAASEGSEILSIKENSKLVPTIIEEVKKEWWVEFDGSKRKMMAECLVPDYVPPEHIKTIYVANYDVQQKLRPLVPQSIPVMPEPFMFFEPISKVQVASNLYITTGDMFFSRMHTLTVSVNCVGVMGKGVASRAKDQFPDVYVLYQKLCRSKKLAMGKPYLYKRESSLDHQLIEDPLSAVNCNLETWFLLFPTKYHWRDQSDSRAIEKGMLWLQQNYKKEGIKSLAMPALGCGLGRLEWENVGPMLCKYLASMDIETWIYLPAEKTIDESFLKREFLLPDQHI